MFKLICDDCGPKMISRENYRQQLCKPDSFWECPSCGGGAYWDDEYNELVEYQSTYLQQLFTSQNEWGKYEQFLRWRDARDYSHSGRVFLITVDGVKEVF
jgi:hypothetical protein